MALTSDPAPTFDVGFFRNTGFALVLATLIAAAITLSLTLSESRIMNLAQEAHSKEPVRIGSAEVTGPIQVASQD